MAEPDNRMRMPLYVGLYFLATLMLFCLVTLMHSFMGGRADNPDIAALNGLQIAGTIISALLAAGTFAYFARSDGINGALHRIWAHIPGWLVFALILLNSLVFIGELSYVVIGAAIDPTRDRADHLSLICLFASSVAFATLFAIGHFLDGKPAFSKSRW